MMSTVQYFTASVHLHFTNHSLSYNERCVQALVCRVQIVECVTNIRAIFKQNKNPYCWALSWESLLNEDRGYAYSSGTDWLIQFHVFTLSQLFSRRFNARNTIGLCWYFFLCDWGFNGIMICFYCVWFTSKTMSQIMCFNAHKGCQCFG